MSHVESRLANRICSSTPLPAARDDLCPEAAGKLQVDVQAPGNALEMPPEGLPVALHARAV